MPTLSYTANYVNPVVGQTIDFTVVNTYTATYYYKWYFYKVVNGVGTLVTPTYIGDTTSTTRNIRVAFSEDGLITPVLIIKTSSTEPPPIYPPNTTDGSYYYTVLDYLNVSVSSSVNFLFSLVRNDLDLATLTSTGYRQLGYKVTQLDPSTLQETVLTNWVTIEAEDTDDYSITVTDDGVYFIYVKHILTSTEWKYILVNIKATKTYLEEQSLQTLTCTPTNDNVYPAFANKDYIYNVISNLSMAFLGVEFDDIAFNYGTIGIGSTLIQGKEYTLTTIGTSTPNWLNQNNVCCLQRKDGYNFDFNSQLETGKIYQCIATGTPTSYGGTTISAYTTDTITYLQNIAGSLYRITQYLNS